VSDAFTQMKGGSGYAADPVPIGKWNLEIPYEIHSIGSGYITYSKYATTWFRIATPLSDPTQDRFLHPGLVSLGCATVGIDSRSLSTAITESEREKVLKPWTDLYDYLILSRASDFHVGTIEVVE